ncbi:MAG: PP2C family protein-serine/threonine phosphatase [Phycisphaerales bacterium]|nr:PP2C family protein-serine/threonine phosphatase [Phycisphaerales bacterium]
MGTLPPGWSADLQAIDDLMRRISSMSDPQEMMSLYINETRKLNPTDGFFAVSRRGLRYPEYRITRSSRWAEPLNPWTQRDRLPLLRGGVVAEMVYANRPTIIERLDIAADDPAREFFEDMAAAVTVPQYDEGQSLNMGVLMWRNPADLPKDRLPNMLWQGNLVGRATLNLVLRRQLADALATVERELEVVGEIQRSLLPRTLPDIPGLDLAASYVTSRQAGGDYYDIFELEGGRWGLFIADVSGHGTPAAVLMAVTHAIAHALPRPADSPGALLERVNGLLCRHYTGDGATFVTACYAIYDPATRGLVYARAGHNPPRVRRGREVLTLDRAVGLPLGIDAEQRYDDHPVTLQKNDLLVLYTDGITEAPTGVPTRDRFGEERLDGILARCPIATARDVLEGIGRGLREFNPEATAPQDDQTLLIARVTR